MTAWCEGSTKGHSAKDGWTLDPNSGQWVCSYCRKPSKMNYESENNESV
jgi:hypothetical protein